MGEYNVFLGWSGAVSKAVAEAWHDWLPLALQGAKPWISSTDIPKGVPWFGELAGQLKDIKIGIICVTPENLSAPAIHFEAGVLSKTVADQQYVCPYLFKVRDSDLGFPLAHFQATRAEREDTRRLVHTIHRALRVTGLTEEQLDSVFEKWWPDLECKLESIQVQSDEDGRPHRSQSEILEELLELVRDLYRRPYSTYGTMVPFSAVQGIGGLGAALGVFAGSEAKSNGATELGPVSPPESDEASPGHHGPVAGVLVQRPKKP